MIPGIDVSEFQRGIDWNAVKASGIQFAMIRASFGDDGGNHSVNGDQTFRTNWNGAKAAGVARGAYHFAYPALTSSPEAEADTFLGHVGALEAGDVLALDLETGNGDLSGWAKRFLDRVFGRTGVRALIYCSSSFYKEHGITFASLGGDYGAWPADWTGAEPVAPGWSFNAVLQYSNQGSVPGIGGRVDLDHFNGDSIAQFTAYGYQGSAPVPNPNPTPPPAPAPAPAPPSSQAGDYVVRGGDNLSAIAQAHGVTLGALIAANPQIPNPNLIYPGQVIHLPGSAPAPAPAPAPAAHNYVVQHGDSMSAIASRFGVSLGALESANPQLERGHGWGLIYPGDVVVLP